MVNQDYVLGFAFNADRSKLVLIKKNRPTWQAGKLNGVGGKIESGETAIDAMCREFFEECGVQTTAEDWHHYMKLNSLDGDVYCYRLFDDKILSAKTLLDEEIIVVDVNFEEINKQGLSNLVWLIGIALDEAQPVFFVEASYNHKFNRGYEEIKKHG
jgi:8-oxo-dGTP diphosphatase